MLAQPAAHREDAGAKPVRDFFDCQMTFHVGGLSDECRPSLTTYDGFFRYVKSVFSEFVPGKNRPRHANVIIADFKFRLVGIGTAALTSNRTDYSFLKGGF